jgi:hypothetical protein
MGRSDDFDRNSQQDEVRVFVCLAEPFNMKPRNSRFEVFFCVLVWWVVSARKEETRLKRLEELIVYSA